MTKAQPTRSKRGFAVISLGDPVTIRRILNQVSHTSEGGVKLRNDIFLRIAQSATLQHLVLDVLTKHPATEREIVLALAKDDRFRRKLLRFADSAV